MCFVCLSSVIYSDWPIILMASACKEKREVRYLGLWTTSDLLNNEDWRNNCQGQKVPDRRMEKKGGRVGHDGEEETTGLDWYLRPWAAERQASVPMRYKYILSTRKIANLRNPESGECWPHKSGERWLLPSSDCVQKIFPEEIQPWTEESSVLL